MEQNKGLDAGWLSPSGEFFPVELYGHLDRAKELAKGINPVFTVRDFGQPDEYLLDNGWVVIYLLVFLFREWAFAFRRRLTPEQLSFMEKYTNDTIPLESLSRAKYEEQRDTI